MNKTSWQWLIIGTNHGIISSCLAIEGGSKEPVVNLINPHWKCSYTWFCKIAGCSKIKSWCLWVVSSFLRFYPNHHVLQNFWFLVNIVNKSGWLGKLNNKCSLISDNTHINHEQRQPANNEPVNNTNSHGWEQPIWLLMVINHQYICSMVIKQSELLIDHGQLLWIKNPCQPSIDHG